MAKPKKSKRFCYKLESLLKVRKIREQQAKDIFNEAQKKLAEEEKKEKEIKAFQTQKYIELTDIVSGGGKGELTDIHQVMARKAHLEVVAEKVEEQIKKKEEAEEKKEEERQNVVKKVKEKRIIEINKDKKRIEWQKFMDKEEGKFLDDISSVGFVKKRRAENEELGIE